MKNLKLSSMGKLSLKGIIVGIILIILSRIAIELLFKFNFSDQIEETIYSLCYIIIFGAIFLCCLSFILLIIQLFRNPI